MDADDIRRRALELFSQGYAAQLQGELGQAVDLYTESIACCPTAEAYTFRGWAYSFQGNYEQAIEECLQAIALDPDFGNPYNDIGAYLIEQGKLDEAVGWLQKAAQAPRYDSPFFAWFNLGRVYERLWKLDKAEASFARALECNRGYAPARHAWRRLRARWN